MFLVVALASRILARSCVVVLGDMVRGTSQPARVAPLVRTSSLLFYGSSSDVWR